MCNTIKNNKNKVRICPFITLGLAILLLLAVLCFALPWLEKGGPNETFTSGIFITLSTLLAVSIGLFLWSFLTMFPVVIIDENGLHKALLHRFFKKTILWEELEQIKYFKKPTVGMWVVFSKSDVTSKSLTKCWLRHDNICIAYSQKLDKLVKQFYGKSIEEATKNEQIRNSPKNHL